mmetsp:Transcript_34007/g.85231  ORF Transcript_34007/g.85231 Transcript_34007/m.85231 type:complete len:203 (+) Transcript_34007:725-1333(+)
MMRSWTPRGGARTPHTATGRRVADVGRVRLRAQPQERLTAHTCGAHKLQVSTILLYTEHGMLPRTGAVAPLRPRFQQCSRLPQRVRLNPEKADEPCASHTRRDPSSWSCGAAWRPWVPQRRPVSNVHGCTPLRVRTSLGALLPAQKFRVLSRALRSKSSSLICEMALRAVWMPIIGETSTTAARMKRNFCWKSSLAESVSPL